MISYTDFQQALFYEIFVEDEYSLLDKSIVKSQTIVDIGWYVGFFSLYCISVKADYKYPFEQVDDQKIDKFVSQLSEYAIDQDIQIHIIEPLSEYLQTAKDILKPWSNCIEFHNFAVWTETTKGQIYLNNNRSMQSSFFQDSFLGENKKSKTVMIYQFDELDFWDDGVDLVKMDIEWAEIDILSNLDKNILSNIPYLVFEYHLVNELLEKEFENIINKLNRIYNEQKIIKSEYDKRLWMVYCSKNS